jgi:hypothetical protein
MAMVAMGVLLAGCPSIPPPPPTGVVDLGPLGIYGTGAGPGSMFANIDHYQAEPDHIVQLSVAAYNTPNSFGGLNLVRTGPGADAVLPAVGEYASGVDGWTVSVAIDWFQRFEVTSLSITELSYRDGVNISQSEFDEFAYPITRMRATFTFLLPSGEEAQGSLRVG